MLGKVPFKGRILMIGYGSVGHCTMPLLVKHIDMPLDRITVVDGDDHSADIAKYRDMGVKYLVNPIVPDNMDEVLKAHLEPGGMLLNLSVSVSSTKPNVMMRNNSFSIGMSGGNSGTRTKVGLRCKVRSAAAISNACSAAKVNRL